MVDVLRWKGLLKDDVDTLVRELRDVPNVEVAEFLDELSLDDRLFLFGKLDEDEKGSIFCELKLESQNELFDNLGMKTFSRIFKLMPSDSRADFYKQLDLVKQRGLIPFLSKKIKADVFLLSSFHDNESGSVMSTDFAVVDIDMTVDEALMKLKQDSPSKKMIYYVYVVDDEMKMLGFVQLYDLILADKDKYISDLIHCNFIYAFVDDDREETASMIERYSLVAIPILNRNKELLGIVRYDDAISVIKNEQTEDIEKLMGITSGYANSEYLSVSSLGNYNKRIGWLIGLFFLGILTSLVLNRYESLLVAIPVLTPFFPMVSSVGGNTGSQSSSVIIRALSLDEIGVRDFFSVVFKEFKISILISITMFFFAFIEGYIISAYNDIGYYDALYVGLTVGISLMIQIVFSSILGAALPILVKLFNMDPAVIATPAIMTIVDVLGVIIYFTVATKMLF